MNLQDQVQHQINEIRQNLSNTKGSLPETKRIEVLDVLLEPVKDNAYENSYSEDLELVERFRKQVNLADRSNLLQKPGSEHDMENWF
jgi:AraC-like DNA-binding protein